MNHMEKVAEMLGVKIGETFKIKRFRDTEFVLTLCGLEPVGIEVRRTYSSALERLLNGKDEIITEPRYPKKGMNYWFFGDGCNGTERAYKVEWMGTLGDRINYRTGNFFLSRKEAEENREYFLALFENPQPFKEIEEMRVKNNNRHQSATERGMKQ